MKHWFDNEIFKRLFKNTGILLVGNSYAYLLAFISYLLTARDLGPEQFGIFIIIQTYVLVVDRLVNFQSWQALIKFGASKTLSLPALMVSDSRRKSNSFSPRNYCIDQGPSKAQNHWAKSSRRNFEKLFFSSYCPAV